MCFQSIRHNTQVDAIKKIGHINHGGKGKVYSNILVNTGADFQSYFDPKVNIK